MLAVVALPGLGAGPAAAESVAPPSGFFGISAPELYSMTLDGRWALRDAALTEIGLAGVESVRTEVGWRDVESQAPADGVHTYTWTGVRRHVVALAEHNQTLAPMLLAPPAWAQDPDSAAACGRRGGVAPAHVADFAAFAAELARAFGRGGSYWSWAAEHRPALPQRPIESYELWNEPNWGAFWCPALDPETYAALAEAAADAIHAVDPAATVSLGGLVVLERDEIRSSKVWGMETERFLERVTAAAPALRHKLDAVGVHTYWETPADNLRGLALVRGALLDLGWAEPELLVTEFGWRSGGPEGAVDELERAALISEYARLLASTNCGVGAIAPHSWITPRSDPNDPEHWFGLADPLTGAPLASGLAYADAIADVRRDGPGPPSEVCPTEPRLPDAPTITAAPDDPSTLAGARFEYEAGGAAGYRCALDDAPYEPCPEDGLELSELADGTHEFAVRAVNVGGLAGPETTRSWTVDTVAPETEISGPALVTDDDDRFELAASETGTRFECRFDSDEWAPCEPEVLPEALGDGPHVLEAAAVDDAGNADPSPAAHEFELWRVAPEAPSLTLVPDHPSPVARARFEYAAPDAGSYECAVDGAAYEPCAAEGIELAGLADGEHRFSVRALNGGGLAGEPVSHAWSVDTVPTTEIVAAPPRWSGAAGAQLELSTYAGTEFRCKLDPDPYGACDSAVNFDELAEGSYVFRAFARNERHRDRSPAVARFAIDRTAPETSITAGPGPAADRASFEFTALDASPVRFRCRLDGERYGACRSPVELSDLAPGRHRFRVRAIDRAGNRDRSPAIAIWKLP